MASAGETVVLRKLVAMCGHLSTLTAGIRGMASGIVIAPGADVVATTQRLMASRVPPIA